MILMLLVAATTSTTGREWQVGGSTPDFTDLQTAFASIDIGDTLLLAGGDWHGAYVPPVDVIVAPMPGETVRLVVDDSDGDGAPSDGFFRVTGGVSLTVRDVEIDGQGLYRLAKVTNGGLLRLERVNAHGGFRDTDGGAIFGFGSGSRIELVDSTLADNAVLQEDEEASGGGTGGAISLDVGVELYAERTVFSGNTATGHGGAVRCRGACTFLDSVFLDNHSLDGDGGAVFLQQGTGSVVRGNLVCGNSAVAGNGGGIAITAGVDEFTRNVVWGNDADSGGGLWAGATLTLWNNDFVANSASNGGAAIVVSSGTTTSRNDLFVDHTAGDDLAAVDGGALDADWLLSFGNSVPDGAIAGAATVIEEDPLFVDLTNDCETADLHLLPESPAIGQGDGVHDDDIGAFPCEAEVAGDGIDQDCDGTELCFEDWDRDGYGSTDQVPGPLDCTGDGVSAVSVDCDDRDGNVFPGSTELPVDGVDQDCDGAEDCYTDTDLDGYGDGQTTPGPLDCVGEAITDVAGDCDDADGQSYPGAPELCDDVDQDCDNVVQEEPPTWYDDLDRDGFGDAATGEARCDPEPNEVTDATDCDDEDPAVFPGAVEVCDHVDQDCDGAVDEDLGEACDPAQPGGGGGPGGRDPVAGGEDEVVGCGCAGSPAGAPWWVLLLVVVPHARRRVQAAR